MSIGTKIDLMSHDLKNKCLEEGWWHPNEQFNWKKVIGEAKLVGDPKNIFPMRLKSAESRYASGLKMLKEKSEKGNSLSLGICRLIFCHFNVTACIKLFLPPMSKGGRESNQKEKIHPNIACFLG